MALPGLPGAEGVGIVMNRTGAADQWNTLTARAAAVWRCLAARRRGVLATVMIAPGLAVPAVVVAAPSSAAAAGAIGAVSAGTANGVESPSGPIGASAAASATQTPSGVPFQVTYDGKSFAASLPPSSIATYTWTPGSNTVGVTETETAGGSLVKGLKLARQPSLSFGPSSGSLPTVTVKPSIAMQKITGFGGAMTQSSASLINNSVSEKKIMDALFGQAGAHFSIVRVPMAASDFVTGPIYQNGTSFSYDDNGGKANPTLANFSIGTQSAQGTAAQACADASSPGEYGTGDYADTIPALRCAKAINPSLNLLAVPWSAPGWMKIDDSTVPGHCTGSDDFLQTADYPTYTSYFRKFLKAYQSAGLPVSEISMQNEPENCSPTYPTMEMKPSDQATFAEDLYSGLRNPGDGLSVTPTIMAYDHNYLDSWNGHTGGVTGYPEAVIKQSGGTSTKAGPVGLVGFHHYNGTLAQEERALDKEHHAYPNVPIWMTEATGTYGSTTQAQNFVWEGQHDLMEPLQNWASASLYLNLALNSRGKPHHGGCGYRSEPCRGMVTLHPDGTYTLHEDYYDWAQFSKFIQPGATHICSDIVDLSTSTVDACTSASSSWIPTGSDNLIDTVAFQNPNGSIVLVVLNTSSWTGTEAPLPANASAEPGVVLTNTACAAASDCAAVGGYTDASGHSQGLLLTGSASSWTAAEAPLPADAATNAYPTLTSVACPSTTSCVAVGIYIDSSGRQRVLAVTGSGTSWTAAEAPLPANARINANPQLNSVACPSTTSCVAVGYYYDSSGTGQGLLVTGSGASWTATEAPLPANASNPFGDSASLSSVACPSTTSCTAVGQYTDVSDYAQGLLVTGSGASWTATEAPLPANAVNTDGNSAYLSSVACPTTTSCTAVGWYPTLSSGRQGLLITGWGTSWTAAEAPLPANAVTNPQASLGSVACPSTTCTAFGWYDTNSPSGLMALTGSRTSWTVTETPLPRNLGRNPTGADAGLESLACPSTASCIAVGYYYDSSSTGQGLLVTGSGASWTATEAPLPANAIITDGADLSAAACSSTTSCLAVGGYTDSSGNTEGLIVTGPN